MSQKGFMLLLKNLFLPTKRKTSQASLSENSISSFQRHRGIPLNINISLKPSSEENPHDWFTPEIAKWLVGLYKKNESGKGEVPGSLADIPRMR